MIVLPRLDNHQSWADARKDPRAVGEAIEALAGFEQMLGNDWRGWTEGVPLARVFFVRLQHQPAEGVKFWRMVRALDGVPVLATTMHATRPTPSMRTAGREPYGCTTCSGTARRTDEASVRAASRGKPVHRAAAIKRRYASSMGITWWERLLELDDEECLQLASEISSLGLREVAVTPHGAKVNVAFRDSRTSRSLSLTFPSAEAAVEGMCNREVQLVMDG